MKTPFDAILRVRQRELEMLRRDFAELAKARSDLANTQDRLADSVRQELLGHAGRGTASLPCDDFVTACRSERGRISGEIAQLDMQIAAMRDELRDQMGAVHALEQAAARSRSEQEQAMARAEQAASDEWALSRHIANTSGSGLPL